MEMPVFPKEFVLNHCSKTRDARYWRKIYNLEGDGQDDVDFAECAFINAGFGMKCENCNKFLSGVSMTDEEKKFLPMIRKYYDDIEKYEKHCAEEEKLKLNNGAGI